MACRSTWPPQVRRDYRVRAARHCGGRRPFCWIGHVRAINGPDADAVQFRLGPATSTCGSDPPAARRTGRLLGGFASKIWPIYTNNTRGTLNQTAAARKIVEQRVQRRPIRTAGRNWQLWYKIVRARSKGHGMTLRRAHLGGCGIAGQQRWRIGDGVERLGTASSRAVLDGR